METSDRTAERACAKHGAYQAKIVEIMGRTIAASHCPTCAAEDKARQDERERRESEEAKSRRIEALFKRAAIPLRFQPKSFENYQAEVEGPERALRIAKSYAEKWPEVRERGTCLIFAGSAGTGKTHLACAIANAIMAKGSSALFTTVSDALRSIKRAYDKDAGVSETDAIAELVEPSLLILDEVGMDYGTDHSKTLLFDVINKRYENIRPTIILTNLDAAALRDYFGDRIVDRLREGGGKLVTFTWASHRA